MATATATRPVLVLPDLSPAVTSLLGKAKYTLDLNDTPINEQPNEEFATFMAKMELINDRLLDFVTENQLKILGRKNLSRDESKMLQIRTVRTKYDKHSGVLNGHAINLSTPKFAWDGMGGKYARTITVCDHKGAAVPQGQVAPGDVVAANAAGAARDPARAASPRGWIAAVAAADPGEWCQLAPRAG